MNLRKGEVLVEFGKVFKVTDISKKPGVNGNREPHVVYRPYFKKNVDFKTVCTIPVNSLDETSIRKPLKKGKITGLLSKLEKEAVKESSGTKIAEDAFKENSFEKLLKALKALELEKRGDENLSQSKRSLYKKLINMIAEEVAFSFRISLEGAKGKVEKKLSRVN